MNLKGRIAIVTGATRGIGRSIALRLAKEGVNVAFNYLNNTELAKKLSKEIEGIGVSALSFKANVSDYKEVQKLKDAVLEKFGSIDILINNAGIVEDAALAMMTQANWKSVIETNLTGTFNMTKAVIVSFMKQKRGDVVNISSISGIHGMAGQTNYAASKGGIVAFSKSLAKEVAVFNIRVNVVAPGFIETDMVSNLGAARKEKALKMIPLGRFGKSEEVANVVNFLLSDAARYITGQVINIDGGMSIV